MFGWLRKRDRQQDDLQSTEEFKTFIASMEALIPYLRSCVGDHDLLIPTVSTEELGKAIAEGAAGTTVLMKADLRLGLVVFQAATIVFRETAADSLPIEIRANGPRVVLMNLFDLGDETATQVYMALVNASTDVNQRIEAAMGTEAEAELDGDNLVDAFAVGVELSQRFLAAYTPGGDPPQATAAERALVDDLLSPTGPA